MGSDDVKAKRCADRHPVQTKLIKIQQLGRDLEKADVSSLSDDKRKDLSDDITGYLKAFVEYCEVGAAEVLALLLAKLPTLECPGNQSGQSGKAGSGSTLLIPSPKLAASLNADVGELGSDSAGKDAVSAARA